MSKRPKKNLTKIITKAIRDSSQKTYVSKEERQDNLDSQVLAASKVLELMRDYGDSGEGERKIEFFFYTDSLVKAHMLANHLRKLDYSVEVEKSAHSQKLLLINGWTTPIKTDDETVTSWAEHMSILGSNCDCKFDGWGTFMELE